VDFTGQENIICGSDSVSPGFSCKKPCRTVQDTVNPSMPLFCDRSQISDWFPLSISPWRYLSRVWYKWAKSSAGINWYKPVNSGLLQFSAAELTDRCL